MPTTSRTALAVERLEGRDMMSVTASVANGVLTFTGDGADDTLQVYDSGASGVGNVRYRFSPTGAFQTVNADISQIVINTNGGIDHVIYDMSGNLAYGKSRAVVANLGDGADEFAAYIRGSIDGPVPVQNPYSVVKASGLTVKVNGGAGGDQIGGTMLADVLGGSSLTFSFAGEGGSDELDAVLLSDVDISANARVGVNLTGGDGFDNLVLYYQGQLDGKLIFTMDGGADGDDLFTQVSLDDNSGGSIGEFTKGGFSRMAGDAGTDSIRYYERVTNYYNSVHVKVFLDLYGGADQDTFTIPPWMTPKDLTAGETVQESRF